MKKITAGSIYFISPEMIFWVKMADKTHAFFYNVQTLSNVHADLKQR